MKKNKKQKGGNNGSLSKRDNEKQKSSQKEESKNNSELKEVKSLQNNSNQKIIEQAKMRSSANFEDEDDVMRGDEDSPRQIIPQATLQNIKLEKIEIQDDTEIDSKENIQIDANENTENEVKENTEILQNEEQIQSNENQQNIEQQCQESLIKSANKNEDNIQQEIKHTADHFNLDQPKKNLLEPCIIDNRQFTNEKKNLKSERHALNGRKNSLDMDAENSFVNVQSPETSNNQNSNQAHKRKQSLPNLQMNSKRSAMKSKIINMTEKKEYKQQPKAIPLIIFNQSSQQFEITDEAKEIANQIKGPIGIVSVVGMYRTGKSYLLNRVILNVQKGDGFGVGPTINPCTKGLWMWAQPLIGYTDNGEKINVIVVDTEGMGGLDEDNNHDMRIFSLALLLSSYFVYNSMGSIDENALSGLSFVTNITQHLASKSNQKNKEENVQEFMPKFLWIVRDFSLQLVDDQENEINSKQYLERALMDYNIVGGVSGSTNFNGERTLRQNKEFEQKNEIKRSLRKYFKDRDCCTIVRPLVDENNLQNLENMNISDLRSEFVESIMVLRNKILNGIRIKQINGCKIDGNIWIQMAQQYIDSINGGSVPSIENSWSYIQKQRAYTMYEQIKYKFDQGVANDIQIPANERELDQCLEFHSENSLNELSNNFQGDLDIIGEYTSDLQQFLTARQIELKNQNLNECQIISQNTLAQLFQELNQRLLIDTTPTAISQNIQSLEFTFQEILTLYEQNVPEFQDKLLIFLNMKNQFLNQLVYFVHQHLDNQIQQTNKLLTDLKDRNSCSIQETKDLYRLEKQTLETQLKEAMINKAESQATLELLKEQYSQLRQQKEQEDQEYQSQLKKMKDLSQKKVDELKTNKEEFEEKMQEMNRKNIKIQSEYEKEKALFEQKVLFLQKSLDEKTVKEREYMNNWTNHKSELSNEIRQISQKYESELKNIQQILEEEREKFHDVENQLSDIQSEYSLKTELWKDQEQRYKQMIDQAQEHAKQLENASDILKNENLHSTENKLKDKINEIEELQKKLAKYEDKANSAEEDLKYKLQQNLKDMAIKEQKLEFLTIQLKETKDQLDEVNKQHQQMLEAMNNTQREEIMNRDSSRDYENFESPSKSQRLQKKIDEMKLIIANLQDKLQEQDIQLKLQESDLQKSQKDQIMKIGELEKERNLLNEQLRIYQQQLGNNIEQIELKHKEEIMRLEQEMEEKQQCYESDIKSIQSKSEESLAQLKNFYEQEKEKHELRLREEREKAQKKIDQYHEEFDIKMRNDFQEKDEEMDILRQDFAELQQRNNQQMTQIQHELSLKQQIIDTMEKQLEEGKQRLGQFESTRNQAFEKQLEFFEQSRQEYSSRIDKLQSENLDKDRQIAQLQHKLERLQDESQRKTRDLQESQESLQKQRDSLQDKLEITKKKFTELQDEAQQNQLIFGRDQALSQQSIEFLQRKIDEMQNMFDEKINIRQEIMEENQTNIERAQTEKDMWEQKFEQKRKALKEIEQQFNRENSELEKKLCLLQEKFTRLDQDKRKQEQDFQEKIHDYEAQIQNLDSSAGEAFYYGNAQAEQMMQLKTQQQELERQLSDLQSTYDKDKALWEGKCTFLENQKESYKKDLIESQRKFEITLEQLQKRGNHVQDKYEQNQNAMVKVIENKYKTQIKEMLESHQCLQNEIQNKTKRMEEENKRLKEQNAVVKRESDVERQQLEFRIQELQKQEVSLKNDISELRNEKEKKLNQYQLQAQKDREIYKQRIAEAEKKAKDADAKRSQMLFDMEKEKARWQMEYDSILSQKRDQDDIIQNLERRKDMIFKENERLKNEWKHNRNSVERSSIGSGTLMNPNKLGLGLVVGNPTGNITTSSKNLNLQKINIQNPAMMRQGPTLGLTSNINALNGKKSLNTTGQQQSIRVSQQNLPPQVKLQLNNNNLNNQFPLQQMQAISHGNSRYNNLLATNSSDNNSADKTPQILIENQSQGFTQNINVQDSEQTQIEQIDNQPLPEKLQKNMMNIPQQLNLNQVERGESNGRSNHLKLGGHNFTQNQQVKSQQTSNQKHRFAVGNSQNLLNSGSIKMGIVQQQNQFGNTMNFENQQQQFGLSAKTLGSNSQTATSAYNQKTASRYSNKSGLD